MRFYRRLHPFKAISFDLDDTLYSNHPIMVKTDAKMIDYFSQTFHKLGINDDKYHFDNQFWLPFKYQALELYPHYKNDVGLLRLQAYTLGAIALGLSRENAAHVAEQALNYFIEQRSNFNVDQSSHQLLSQLQKKYPLIAISNGNVDTKKIGIAPYFQQHFHASIEHKAKPDPDMFIKACQQLNIAPAQLLHVGDCGKNDVLGAINAGCQTVWLDQYHVGKPLSVLPTIMIDKISQLAAL